MTDQSKDLHEALRTGQQKLSYFLLGLEVAVFAYIGKDFTAEPIALSRNTFELFGLVAFALSIIFGILSLSACIYVQKLNLEHLDLNEQIRGRRLASESNEPHVDFLTSKILNAEELMAQGNTLIAEYQELESYLKSSVRRTELLGLTHTGFLILGFALLATSRTIGLLS